MKTKLNNSERLTMNDSWLLATLPILRSTHYSGPSSCNGRGHHPRVTDVPLKEKIALYLYFLIHQFWLYLLNFCSYWRFTSFDYPHSFFLLSFSGVKNQAFVSLRSYLHSYICIHTIHVIHVVAFPFSVFKN